MGKTSCFVTVISFSDQSQVNAVHDISKSQDLLNISIFFSFSRIQLERAVMLLDLEAKDMNQTLYALVEELNHAGLLEDELKGEVLRILLYK